MLCGWEGNRRSSVALAMVTDSVMVYTHLYGLSGLRKGGEHLAYIPAEYGTFTFTLTEVQNNHFMLNLAA